MQDVALVVCVAPLIRSVIRVLITLLIMLFNPHILLQLVSERGLQTLVDMLSIINFSFLLIYH